MTKSFSCFILLVAFFLNCSAQQTTISKGRNKISGTVIDSSTGKPIEFATVIAVLNGNTKPVNGNISEKDGRFVIDSLGDAVYDLKIDFIGYKNKIVPGISLSNKKPNTNLGKVLLASNSKSLDEVTVTGSKSFLENHIDKMVFNVGNDITSQGGIATDVLKKVPQVSVDVNGNVELQGNSNVRVFINGKPSTMFDNNLADALAVIPASEIEKIEVITSPGAQYDADGTAGIINILLKQHKEAGMNGSANVSVGTRLENGSININRHKGPLNINLSLSGNTQLTGSTITNVNRTATDSIGDKNILTQNGDGLLGRYGYKEQLGVTWDASKNDIISAAAKLNNFGYVNSDNTSQELLNYYPDNTLQSDAKTNRRANSPFRAMIFDWNINYKKKFKEEGQELNFSYQSSTGNNTSAFDQRQKYDLNDSVFTGSKGDNTLRDRETNITLDYSQPINKNAHLDMGVKTILSRIESNSDYYTLNTASNIYLSDTSQFDNFTYNRNVYAGYLSLSYMLTKKINLKAGVREERTETDASFSTSAENIVPSYNSFIPSATVAFKLNKNQTLKFSYSKRLQRPEYRILNPFINASDPTNVSQGNPALKPERSDYGEITYSRFFDKGGSILINGFYRYTRDDEQNYIYYYPSLAIGDSVYKNVAVNTNVNAGTQQMLGANIYGSLPIGPNLEIHGNIFAFHKYIESNIIPGNTFSSYNYRMNLNATYKIGKSLVVEFFGDFHSARTEIQGKFPSFSSYTFAARKIFNKKASMGFTTTDPFNQYVSQKTDVSGPNFALVSEKKIPYQSFGVNFSYKFGSSDKKEEKQERDNPDDVN